MGTGSCRAGGPLTAVEARGLSVRYEGRPEPALRGISFTLAEGELACLAGPSGSGKTTLLSTILGYIPEGIPAKVQGELFLFGEPAPPLSTRAGQVGLVQQDPESQICTLRVRDEVAFGPENLCLPREEIARRVEQALSTVGLEGLSQRPTWTLSGGEKQRLALASILAMEPKTFLFDEPTAHLDPPSAVSLLRLIAAQREAGHTIILAEHRLGPLFHLLPEEDSRSRSAASLRLIWLSQGRLAGGWDNFDPELARGLGIPLRGFSPLLEGCAQKRVPPSGKGAVLSIHDLHFSYPSGRELFGGLSFSLAPGEILGVIGENGSGKTTLLRLISGLERANSGEIAILGKRANGVEPAQLAKKVGFVFQMPHHQLLASTVAEEFSLGGSLAKIDGEAWLSRAALGHLRWEHPLRLSIGERRRLTIALALSRQPRLLLLDEPFIGQDQENMRWIVREIQAAADSGVGIILVSHDIPAVAELCHRVLYLGKEAILGQPDEVFRHLAQLGKEEFTPEFWEAR